MSKIKLQIERAKLSSLLVAFEREEAHPQGALDRVFGEDRKRHLISRIAYMNGKIALLEP